MRMVVSWKKKIQEKPLYLNDQKLKSTDSHCHLGVVLSSNLTWHSHIVNAVSRANKRVDIMCRLAHFIDRRTLTVMFNSFIRPVLEYGDILYNNCNVIEAELIELVQKRAARIITGAIKGTPSKIILSELGWSIMQERRENHCLCLFH